MTNSKLIAALTGPLFITVGASAILNRDMFPRLAQETGLIFLTGILMLLAGLAIIRVPQHLERRLACRHYRPWLVGRCRRRRAHSVSANGSNDRGRD